MLKLAYHAAHEAYSNGLTAHAALLTTPLNLDVKQPGKYEYARETTPRHNKNRGLENLRTILNRPDIFDVINIHNRGDLYEIEHLNRCSITKWQY